MGTRGETMGTAAEITGAAIGDIRRSHGLSLRELGERVGEHTGKVLHKQVVWKIEQGQRRIDTDELLALALVLGVPAVYLLAWRADEVPDNAEIVLSPQWTMTAEELRRTVLGDYLLEADRLLTRRVVEAMVGVSRATKVALEELGSKPTVHIKLGES